MHERVVIWTPEGVSFEHELASIPARAMAWLIDLFVLALALLALGLGLGRSLSALGGFGAALYTVLVFLIQWGYGTGLEWALGGKTLGKAALGLAVVNEQGLRIGFLQAAIRNLVRVVDLLPGLYGVGGVTALLDPKSRRLGDLAAGTLVIRDRRAPRPTAFLSPGERENSLAQDPRFVHAARRITPPERDVLIALGLRRDQIPLAVRGELFERMATHLSERLGLTRPSFLSAEKFCLQLTALAHTPPDPPRGARP